MQTENITIVHVFDVANGGTSYGSGIFLGDFISLTNNPSCRVVKFNRRFVYQSKLKLTRCPFDITKINDLKVTIEATPQIFIIDVLNMKIEKISTVNHSFWGLQYVFPEYIVEYCGKITLILHPADQE